MVIRIPQPDRHPDAALRRLGYVPFRDPKSGTESYVRRLGTHYYPRFHVYVDHRPEEMKLNLHLDQKQASYEGFRKHSGEYDGPTVEAEAERIYGVAGKPPVS